MSPQKLTSVLYVLFAVAFISFAAVFVFNPIAYLGIGAFMVSILTSCALPYLITVKCPAPGCQGTMQRVWGQGPNCSQNLSYRCRICGKGYDTGIGYGGGSSF